MTFGPITVNRPGASATVGIMGPVGKTGTPGTNGAPGPQGPAVFTPIAAWVSGLTYAPSTATQAASYVSIGGSSYACTTLHTSGVFVADLAVGLWEPVALQGTQGVPGTPGSTWYSGLGAPSSAVGINGDYFLRTDIYDILLKVSGDWSKIGNIQGLAGNTIQNGTGAPPSGSGNNGDFYLDTTSTAPRLYGPKANGAWPSSGISLLGSGAGSVNPTGSFTTGDLIVAASADGKTIQDSGVALSSLATAAQIAALPSSSSPAMDGTASPGTAVALARADHVHPSDVTKLAVAAVLAEIAAQGVLAQAVARQNIGTLSKGRALALAVLN